MCPGGHLVTTTVNRAGVHAVTGSVGLVAGLAAGGVFIDVDHIFDYVAGEPVAVEFVPMLEPIPG
jgi:hypothetical protein